MAEEPLPSKKGELTIGGDRPIRISAGHRIQHHDGKCSRPHGHNYEITVEATGPLGEEGWVADKGVITSVIEGWDHQFLLEEGDPLIDAFEQAGDGDAVVVLDHPPTAEVMSTILVEKIQTAVESPLYTIDVTVAETNELCGTAHDS